MSKYRIFLPYPPTVNTYWRHARGRNYISEKGTRYRAEVIAIILRERLDIKLTSRLKVKLLASVPDRRIRDIDNLFKAPLDALVHGGMINDDGQIDDLRIIRGERVKGGALEIVITELEAA
ncbi:RusA family crossover junction endodeoxyribonuclease [Sodalis sp. RH22]|uniref:RusA family crossover junction endodeoxyribonuclease n=1 Tax=unclassified Sodalis (in: enterobacteria) TaxID=2636512 RepID=UPI0039B5CD92